MKLPGKIDQYSPLKMIYEVEYLFSYLNDWHSKHDVVDTYLLHSIEGIWTANAAIIRPISTWGDIVKCDS